MADHLDLHAEQGALAGEHPGRHPDPVIKVHDLAWLSFTKPDLARAEAFASAFGFTTSLRTAHELHLRGTRAGSPAAVIHAGRRSTFLGPTFQAAEATDLLRLADATGTRTRRLPESIGGLAVDLVDPSGLPVTVVADTHVLPELEPQEPQTWNVGDSTPRTNAAQRPPRAPARVERLGHVVLQSTRYVETLDWYLEHLGMIVSDFKFFDGQRERGPVMSFVRCDRGDTPADHHTLAMTLGPRNRYVHSAYQVADLDAMAAGGEHLLDLGYVRSWGIGRHVEGSQIFDYWRDPDGFLVEHFSDGDLFDCSLDPGWSAMTASGLAQWGPPATPDFLGIKPGKESLREMASMIGALRGDTEFDLTRLRGLIGVART